MTSYISGDIGGVAFVTDSASVFSLASGIPITDTSVSTQTLAAALVADADVFYQASEFGGTRFLNPAIVTDADVFYASVIHAATGGYTGLLPGALSTGNASLNSIFLTQVVPQRDGVATAVLLNTFFTASSGGNIKALIYDSAHSVLLASGSTVNFPQSSATTYIRLPLTTDFKLVAGTTYYVGYVCDASCAVSIGFSTGVSSWWVNGGQSVSTPANPLVGGTSDDHCLMVALELDHTGIANFGYSLDRSVNVTLSSSNTVATISTAQYEGARSIVTHEARVGGKWYAEIAVSGTIDPQDGIGFAAAAWNPDQISPSSTEIYYVKPSGAVWNGTDLGTALLWGSGDVIGLAFDAANLMLWWNKNNGSWYGWRVGDPAINDSGQVMGTDWPVSIMVTRQESAAAGNIAFTLRDRASALQYSPPSGFRSWAPISLAPGLVVDIDLFYAPTIGGSGATLTPAVVTDNDVFYSPIIVRGAVTLAPSLIVDTDIFYVPVSAGSVTLAPSLYVDADAFFIPTVTVGAVTLVPSFITDADAFFTPTITTGAATLIPGLIADVNTFFAPVITTGTVTLNPGLITDADIFYAPALIQFTGGLLLPPRYVDPDVFYPFSSKAVVIPIWYRETDTIYSVSVSFLSPLNPPLFNAVDTFYVPRIGQAFLYPALVTDTDVIRATTVSYTFPVLKPSFINADVVIYTPTVVRANAIAPARIVDTDIFRVPNILRGSLTLRPSRVIDPDIFLSPIIGIVQVTPNPPGGDPANLPGNIKYVSKYTMAQSGLILSLDLQANSTKTVNTRMVIYRDSAGLPGILAGVTTDKTSVVTGVNHYTLIAPMSVLAGDNIWMGLHSDGNFNWFLSNSPGGSKYNTDTWVGGASDPFGPPNNDNKKAPIVVYYLASSNATFTVDKVIDLDVFYPPAFSQINILRPSLVVEEFFYSPVVRSIITVAPDLYVASDVFYAPARTGAATIRPLLFVSDDAIYSPFVASFSPTVFSAAMSKDDVFYSPEVTDFGANLLPQQVVDTDILHLPVRSGLNVISPPLTLPSDVFHAPIINRGPVTIAPPLLNSDTDFYLPEISVVGGADAIRTDIVTDIDVFYLPRKSGNAGWRRQVFIAGLESDEISIIGEIPTPELVE